MNKRKTYLIYTVLIALGLIALSACERETVIMPDSNDNRIYVTGSATVTTTPDIAITQLGVQTYNTEVEPAVDENNQKAEAIIAALRAQGVEDRDMKTSYFSIYPQRDYSNNGDPNKIIGYQVNNSISVTLRDLDAIGRTLQVAITAGANTISGLSFTLDDPEPLRDEARTKAIEDARRRAESMAEAAGIELGKVISVSETSSGYYVARAESYDAGMAKSEVPIEPGELELTIQVSMVFEIAE